MRILHLVKVIFDKRTPAITKEWLEERYKFFVEHTLKSLEQQTLKGWVLWISCGVNMSRDDVKSLKAMLYPFALKTTVFITFDKEHSPFGEYANPVHDDPHKVVNFCGEREFDYVYITRVDSDDILAPDALQLAHDVLPREMGRTEASMFRRGYMYDVRTKEVDVYFNPSSPFHTLMVPRDVFCSPERYAALDYGDHSKVNSTFYTHVLPDWRFTVLIHGNNFLSTMDYANERETPVERSWTYERFLQQPVTFDVDDFCDRWNCLPELDAIKKQYPNFRCTLFTIPGKTSIRDLWFAGSRKWVELAWHGIDHEPNEELKSLSASELKSKILKMMEWHKGWGLTGKQLPMVKGFRPPGWYITKEHIKVLNELGMWVALHKRDAKELGPLCDHGYYCCDQRPYWHAHTSGEGQNAHSVCHNGIRETLPELLKKWPRDQQFSFVSDSVLVNPKKVGIK